MTSLNIDPTNPLVVPSSALVTQAEFNMAHNAASTNVNVNIWRLIQQYWTETTYTDEANYNLATRSIPDNWWNAWYRDVLSNLEHARVFARTDVSDAAALKNDSTIIDIMECYAYFNLVATYGNIPYSQALNPSNTFPKYDDAKTVFYDIISRLGKDAAALNPSAGSWGNADIIYGGNPAAWAKFAYTLQLKMGALVGDSDPTESKTVMEAAAPHVFTSNADNAMFAFQTAPPYTNPVWVDLVQSGRHDFVATSTMVDMMTGLNDPRIGLYFSKDGNSSYSGGDPGAGANYPDFSHASDAIQQPSYPGDLLDYAETRFYLAEGAARGFKVGLTAEQNYDSAITASIEFWGGSATDAATYLAQPSVAYATAAGTWQQKIGTQLFIALYNRGWDSWTEYRQLNYPTLVAPPTALSVFPQRFLYPSKEENVNTANWQAASTAIGGDQVGTKLWFDKN
jgi:hypothetical protein